MKLTVNSDTIHDTKEYTQSEYSHRYTRLCPETETQPSVEVLTDKYHFRTQKEVGKVGLMVVGLGGNNGTTLLGGLLANKHKLSWMTKKGEKMPNLLGSMTQAGTIKVADTTEGELFLKIKDVITLVDPTDLVISGWDINSANLAEAMQRAEVFDYTLQQKLKPYMREYTPLKSLYYPEFIASNQKARADNIIPGKSKHEHYLAIRSDIATFKKQHGLKQVIILWSATTQKMIEAVPGVHDDETNLMEAITNSHSEISPSVVFAMASLHEDCVFINGSPQNTLLDGIKTVNSTGMLIGNDFKTGQTKFKTAFMDFLIGSGIKPKSIVSYNHLGNNDGQNLSSEKQFRSKEISKSKCVSDILQNSLLYNPEEKEPDHVVVIKYVPEAGDSKKAIDEYSSEIFMGGEHTFVSYNVCEDSLLAAGVIIDLIVLAELLSRVSYAKAKGDFKKLSGVNSFLGYLMKAPEAKGPVINSLKRQKSCIENLIRVLIGLPLEDDLLLGHRL